MRKKIYAIIVAVVTIILIVGLALSIIDFYPSGGLYGEDVISDHSGTYIFAPHIVNKPTFTLSMGYTPSAGTIVLYCTYTITDSNHKIIDSSIMLHSPLASEYVLSKTYTNIPNDNYTLMINARLADGKIRTPVNSTITVDTSFIEPELIMISPQNQTYNTNAVDLIYHINSKVVWAYYSLDDQDSNHWQPFNGNITINGLSEGMHELSIAVKTEANQYSNFADEVATTYFRIAS